MFNVLQISQRKLYLIDFSIEQSTKLSREVLAVSVPEFHQSIAVQLYQPTLIKWLSLLCVYKETTVSVIRESLSISCHAFVSHLQSVSWSLAEFLHNKIVQLLRENCFNVCRQLQRKVTSRKHEV